MASFSVVLCTAAPPGFSADSASGAYLKIDGREALLKSLDLFANRDSIVQMLLIVSPNKADDAKQKFAAHLGFSGIKLIVAGPRWIDQLAAANEKLGDATHVIVHDAARPAVAFSDIDALLLAAEKSPIVALSTPIRATLAELDEGGQPLAIRPAREFAQIVTPIAYDRATFTELATSKAEPHASRWSLLPGHAANVRVNSPGDAGMVSAMIKLLPKPKIKSNGTPFDEAQW